MAPIDLEALHQKSSFHAAAIAQSLLCGCFHCLRMFPPDEIKEWVARDGAQTAICPHCSVDAVLPSSEVPLSDELLSEMHARWFRVARVSDPET